MKLKNIIRINIILISALLFHSCSEKESELTIDPLTGMVKITETNVPDANVRLELYANEELFVGYNQVAIVLYDLTTNQLIEKANVAFAPLMTMMGGTKHACPYENPVGTSTEVGIFKGALTFIMPSSDVDFWKLTITIDNLMTEKQGAVELPLTVVMPANAQLKSFMTDDGGKYFVSYFFSNKAKVGINDISFLIHKKESMMDFPAVEDFIITMVPEMPSMDHGSPNNINPIHTQNGHYEGKVNLTMTGEWRVNLLLTQGLMSKEISFDFEID